MYKFITKKIDFLIPLLIIGFSFFVAYHDVGSGIVNYIDHSFPFYFSDYLNKLFFMWNDYIYLGSNHSTNLVNSISYYSIFYFFEKIGFNYILLNKLEHIISIFCIVYFTYLFLQSLFKGKIKILDKLYLVLVSTFFLTNISTTGLFTMGLTQGVFALSGIPLVLFSLRKYGLTHRKIFLLPMIIGSLIITSFNLPYNVISIIAVLLLAILFNDIDFKLKIKNIFIFLIIWLFLNSFWIMPMFYSIFIAPPYNLKATLENLPALRDVMQLTATRYTLDQLLRLGINLNLVRIQNSDNSLMLNYFASGWFILLSYITVISLLLRHLIFKKEKNKLSINSLFLVCIFLVFIFLAKGSNQPFGGLYNYFFDNTIAFKMFRDSLKWMTIPFLVVTILMANTLVDNSKKWLKSIIVLFLLFNLFPWFYDGLMGKLRAYDVPDYYFSLNNSYRNAENTSDKRAIILDSAVAPTSFEFDVKTNNKNNLSSNILKFISPFPTVDLFSNGGGISFDYINNIFRNLKRTDEDLYAFQKIGATHIYHQKDINNPSTYKYTSKYFNKVAFGKLDVYEIKNEYTIPKIFLAGTKEKTEVIFSKVNPTKYLVRINNLKEKTYLNFLYTFDQNWGIYPKKFSPSFDCAVMQESNITSKNNIIDNYGENNTISKECAIQEKFYEGDELGYLGSRGVFTDSHDLLNKLFNKWTIDPEYIKQNFPEEDYKENPDGSIDVELTLYFKPQSYFYLGLIVSATTLLGCLGYLTYDWRRRRIIKSNLLKK